VSLLSQPFAVPSRVKGAVKFLVQERGQRAKRNTAEALLSPASLKGDEGDNDKLAMIRRTIDECLRLHLFVEDGEYLAVNRALPEVARNPNTVASALPGVLLDLILNAEGENQDLAAPLAWFLGQDALEAPATWTEFGNALQAQGMADVLKFNNTRYDNFWYWARYLGLANVVGSLTASGTLEERLLPDPTDCLRPILHEVLAGRGGRLSAAECLRHVSARCPLFEGGEIRDTLDRHTRAREPRHLSSTTSFALLRLEEEGTLAMGLLSDADALVLVDGPDRRSVSEITLVQDEAAGA
jgi:hypothetical protein